MKDGDQATIRLALSHVTDAQEVGQDGIRLRFGLEGWWRFRALTAQAEEGVKAGKTLSSDESWARALERAEM